MLFSALFISEDLQKASSSKPSENYPPQQVEFLTSGIINLLACS